jgi:signal transduction histidine kinase
VNESSDFATAAEPVPPRSVWLSGPFLVLALLVVSLFATPLWIEHSERARAAPAAEALASSARALDALVEMRAQQPAAAAGSAEEEMTRGDLAAAAARLRAASDRLEDIRAESVSAAHGLSRALAMFGLAGGVLAFLLVRHHQRLLRRWMLRAGERAEELEQFASRVAHDIVSPLGAVTAGVHMLSQKLRFDPRGQGIATTVRGSVDRVAAIVDELLRFAWAGGRAAAHESADLAAAVQAVHDELLPDAVKSGVSLTFAPVPDVRVACAEAAVIVVLQNLVRNALKHIGKGPKRMIHASVSVLAGSVRLFVRDNGPGIPKGMEQAVFKPYVRVEGTESPGIGLGLATVKRIVESRAGSVGVLSEPQEGATFWVELPLAGMPLH